MPLLGHLAWTLDGRELPELFRERIFKPLGMSQSEPVIDFDDAGTHGKQLRTIPERSSLRAARQAVRGAVDRIDHAAGCIAATARDMGAYVRMIANRGRGPGGNLISPESFELFSKRHIKAEEFGPTASYGYGIAVDELDGNALLRHTGGMVSFMSAMQVTSRRASAALRRSTHSRDIVRTPVVKYALQLMRARIEERPAPAAPEPDVGDRSCERGRLRRRLHRSRRAPGVCARGRTTVPAARGQTGRAGETAEDDQFYVPEPRSARFALVFGRKPSNEGEESDEAGPVVEVSWGDAWYAASTYDGPREFDVPDALAKLCRSLPQRRSVDGLRPCRHPEGPADVERVDGVLPLEADGELFRLRDDPANTEWIRFGEIVNGKCMRLKYSGVDLWRVASA